MYDPYFPRRDEHTMETINNPSTGEVAASPPKAAAPRRVSFFDQINMNVFWMANQFHWNALLAVVIPSMVAYYLGDANKDINLTLVVAWGTLVAFFVNPLVGAISDYARFRMGRRRPFMIIGTIFNVIVLVIFAFSPSWFPASALLLIFALLFLLLQFTNNLANSPWSAIIADKVPQNQRGFTAGLNGLFNLLGTAAGSIVAGTIVSKTITTTQAGHTVTIKTPLPMYNNEIVQIFLLIAIVQIIFVVYTILTVKEEPLPAQQGASFQVGAFLKKFFFKPSRYPDLSWVLLARLLVMMGIWGIFYFLQYYADDVLHVTGEKFIGSFFLPILLLASLPTTILAGWASDHWGRKGMVYISGAMMTIVCLIFIIFQNTTAALINGLFFGIGYGAYTSVDWALATDALPPTDEAGKFMGIWSAMGILPQVIGVTIGGVILQLLRNLPNNFGYTVLFIVTIVYFGLGTLVIRQVRGVK